jgi:hypothetical protein
MKVVILFSFLVMFNALRALAQETGEGISSLRYIGTYEIPFDYSFDSTKVGGLSGIDYDEKAGVFYLLPDDRGSHGQIRFYTVRIGLDSSGIRDVDFVRVTYIQNEKDVRFEKRGAKHNPDPEGIRVNPRNDLLYWVSEGERAISGREAVLQNPFIRIARKDGRYAGTFEMPSNLNSQAIDAGPRQNSSLEGITFDSGFNYIYASVEEPLIEDGPEADVQANGATSRIFKFDVFSRTQVAQFGYPLETVAYPPHPANGFRVNGISEILSTGKEDILLVVERSYSTGRLPCTIRVFLADLSQAADISKVPSLRGNITLRKAEKKLLVNMDDLDIYTDNIEGVSFGPRLKNGHRTLLFVSDNNFQFFQKSQVLLFEVIP